MKKIYFNERYGLQEDVFTGYKTQKRSLMSKSLINRLDEFKSEYFEATLDTLEPPVLMEHYFHAEYREKTPYQVGEIVAVAQSYNQTWQHTGYMTEEDAKECKGYLNKLFVKPELMPNKIRITSVGFEKLRDISDIDCFKEGIIKWRCQRKIYYGFFDSLKNEFCRYGSPREAYSGLVDKICGIGTWEANPYVFVYSFELVK